MAIRMVRAAMLTAAAGVLSFTAIATSGPASADLKLCNKTRSDVYVAAGWVDPHGNGFTSEGWWKVRAGGQCKTVVLSSETSDPHNYFYYAEEIGGGGVWTGDTVLCTKNGEFLISGPARNWCDDVGFQPRNFIHRHSPAGNLTVSLTSGDGSVIIDDSQ